MNEMIPMWVEVIRWIGRVVLGVIVVFLLVYLIGLFYYWLWKKLRVKEEAQCEFGKGCDDRCKSHRTKIITVGSICWVLCHKHAIECGFKEQWEKI